MENYDKLPNDLPVPYDDGQCDHLLHSEIPDLKLTGTNGKEIPLRNNFSKMVIYCYPMTGRPGKDLPEGWNDIPGARGCTPQACSFRDHFLELKDLGYHVYGLSTQTTDYQQEAVERLHLPYPLLSDADYKFINALNLPTFQVEGQKLIKRLTLIFHENEIVKVFYPVFPPDEHIHQVVKWIKTY